MSKFDKTVEKLEQDAIILQYVKTITEQDLVLPEWYELNEDYKTNSHPLSKVIITIRNSILFQRRIFFCMTRKSLRELIDKDLNWKVKGKFTNEKYSYIIRLLTKEFSILKIAQKTTNKRGVDVYQVIDSSILKHLQIDENKQFEQTITFANKFNSLNNSDRKSDQVVSSKEIVVRKTLTNDVFLDILNKEDEVEIVNTLKNYKCFSKKQWMKFILDNCNEEKAKAIISSLGLIKE